jgi:hypothetical protein
MELYILSKQDLNILSICKLADYQINLDEETNAKSTFTLIKTNGLKKENYMVLNGLYRQFIFVIDDVQTEKESDVVTVTALDISNVFNRKVIEKNIDTMKSKSIEEFLANTISENFVNSDDTALNVNYIEIYWHTNTQGNVATNAENGLYNFHTFLTNCRQYKNIYTDFKLENLGNPQTVEGKRISIEAKNRKIVDISLNGESTQNGTPTPDNPIEIENVEGKNKFDINQEKEIFGIMLYKYSYYLKPSTKYTISSNCPASTTANIYANSNSSKSAVYINKNQTIQSDENGYFYILVRFKADASDNSTFNLYEKVLNGTYYIQLEEGTVATPYVPYNSLEIKNVGENLFNPSNAKDGYVSDGSGQIISVNIKNKNTGYIKIDGEEKYFILSNKLTGNWGAWYDKDKKFISGITLGGKNKGIVTAPNNAYFINFTVSYENNNPDYANNVMIARSDKETPYKPYQEQKVTFPLENQKLMEDSYLASDGIHHKRKQIILTGNENWVLTSTGNQVLTKRFSAQMTSPAMKLNSQNNATCTHFINIDDSTKDVESIYFAPLVGITYMALRMDINKVSTVEELKSYLATQYANGTPVIVEYELSEEEIVPYTEAQQEAWDKIKNLTLFEGVNHISSDANMVLKYYPLEPVGLKFVLRIDIEKKQETTKLIDTTLPEVTDYNKIYEEDVTAKVQVYIREDGSEYNLYLKTDRTTTTNKDDPDRASGKIEVISVETADRAEEEALNVMKGNNYKHLVEFKIAKTSKLMDITQLHIGRPIRIKTDDDIYDSYISAITLSDENFVYFKSGSLRITLLDKLKKSNDSAGNKLDVSGGKITGNLNITGILKNNNKTILDLTYPIGSIYLSIKNTNPSSLFGGTWVAWGSGRVPVGINTSDDDFKTVEKTGGEKTHTLSLAEMPRHTHDFTYNNSNTCGFSSYAHGTNDYGEQRSDESLGFNNIAYTGGDKAHNNLQPYITCYMWKRTA